MPVVPMNYKHRVVSIGFGDAADPKWCGTGFFYRLLMPKNQYIPAAQQPDVYRLALVTNKHVLNGNDKCFVKWTAPGANAPTQIEVPLKDVDGDLLWHGHADEEIDVAAIQVDGAPFVAPDGTALPLPFFQSNADVARVADLNAHNVCETDSVFMLGHPIGMSGPSTNTVVFRHGTIAEISMAKAGHFQLFLVDTMILGGNSGSPIVLAPFSIAEGMSPAYLVGIASAELLSGDGMSMRDIVHIQMRIAFPTGLTVAYTTDKIDETIAGIP